MKQEEGKLRHLMLDNAWRPEPDKEASIPFSSGLVEMMEPTQIWTGPSYGIDYEALAYRDSMHLDETNRRVTAVDPWPAVNFLMDRINSRPDWNRDHVCSCPHWLPTHRFRPQRPGAHNNAGKDGSCCGCWYSHLDSIEGLEPLPMKDAAFSRWAAAKAELQAIEFERKNYQSKAEKSLYKELRANAVTELRAAYEGLKKANIRPPKPRRKRRKK